MKMRCANCGSEEKVSIWLKNYNDYTCSKCNKNIMGRAVIPLRIFGVLLSVLLFIIALFLLFKLQNVGVTKAMSLILAIGTYAIINVSLYPLGVRVLYKIFNKSK